jgi:phosphate uptake regulator
MKRRVVKHGTSTLTISLPIDWVKKFKIQSGQELDVQERGNKILIRSSNDISEKELNVLFDKPGNIPKRLLISPFIHGYDLIRVNYLYPEVKIYVYNLLQNYYMGFEIIEESPNLIVLKNVAKGIEEEFDIMLNRLIFLVSTRLKILLEVMKTENYNLLKDNETFEHSADKINLFCKRMLNINANKENKSCSFYSVINYLENISDAEFSISCYLIEKKIKITRQTIDFMQFTLDYMNLWYKLFLKYDFETFYKLKDLESKMGIRNDYSIMNKFPVNQHFIVHSLLMINEYIHNCCEELSY